jgi:hypothetical protein
MHIIQNSPNHMQERKPNGDLKMRVALPPFFSNYAALVREE